MGFKNAETQTLVSSRTTSGTAFRFNLGPGSTDFDLDGLLRDCFGSRPHSAQKALKIAAPLSLGTQGIRDARFFPQPERLQRSKNAVFIDRLKGFLRRDSFLKQCHKKRIITMTRHLGQSRWRRHGEERNYSRCSWGSPAPGSKPSSSGAAGRENPADRICVGRRRSLQSGAYGSRRFGKGCGIVVILRARTSSSSIATLRGCETG